MVYHTCTTEDSSDAARTTSCHNKFTQSVQHSRGNRMILDTTGQYPAGLSVGDKTLSASARPREHRHLTSETPTHGEIMECARAAQSSCRTYSHHDGVALSAGIIARTFCLGLLGSGRLHRPRERQHRRSASQLY